MDILHGTAAAPWAKKAYFFGMLNAGLLLTAVGISIFKTPNHFAFGGTSGLSIVLSTLFPKLQVGAFMWIINAVLVVIGLFALGLKAMGWTVYSSFALSAYVSLCQALWPMTRPLTNDTLLEMCFAVLLPAVGSAMVFDVGASTGGTDIVAMILAKHTSIEIGKALMLSDAAIVAAAAYLYGPATGLYCILGLVAKASVVDGVIENMNLRKVCTVVTFAPDKVQAFILNDLHRSATVENARGAYTQREEVVLTTVLTRHQAAQLRDFLREQDPGAFITIVNSSEIIGKGFRSI
jgi:uncharacterized membrane-anchored protein YitT (DUF2179 family)